MTQIPIVLLTGHLGAGKTTLLNHLLNLPEVQAQRPALIVNEFGRLGIDAMLIRRGDWKIFEINSGSLFCTCVTTRLIRAIKEIATNVCLGLLLVEATGISETRDVELLFKKGPFADTFRMLANLAVVDATNFTKVAAFLKSVRNQVICADGIIVNKTDLISREECNLLHKVLANLNPHAPRIDAIQAEIPWDFVASLKHNPVSGTLMDSSPSQIVSVSVEPKQPLSRETFTNILHDFGDRILRLKGHIDFGKGVRFVEIAGGLLSEREPTCSDARSGFICIGWNLAREDILSRFQPFC